MAGLPTTQQRLTHGWYVSPMSMAMMPALCGGHGCRSVGSGKTNHYLL